MGATPSAKKTSLPISINSCFVALTGTSKVRLPPPLAYRTETNLFLLLLNSISPNAILLVLGAFAVELVSSDELALGLVLRRVDFLFCLSCFSFIISSTNLRFLFSLSKLSWALFFWEHKAFKAYMSPFLDKPISSNTSSGVQSIAEQSI